MPITPALKRKKTDFGTHWPAGQAYLVSPWSQWDTLSQKTMSITPKEWYWTYWRLFSGFHMHPYMSTHAYTEAALYLYTLKVWKHEAGEMAHSQELVLFSKGTEVLSPASMLDGSQLDSNIVICNISCSGIWHIWLPWTLVLACTQGHTHIHIFLNVKIQAIYQENLFVAHSTNDLCPAYYKSLTKNTQIDQQENRQWKDRQMKKLSG